MAGRHKKYERPADQKPLLDETDTREAEITPAPEDLLARNLRKRAAIDNLDRMVTEKVAWQRVTDTNFIDDELQRISKERQNQRESFNTNRKPRNNSKQDITTETQAAADTKIDARVDLLFARLQSAFHKMGGVLTLIKTNSNAKLAKLKMISEAKCALLRVKAAPLIKLAVRLHQKERAVSERIALFVDRMDGHIDLSYDKASIAVGICDSQQKFLRQWAEKYKKPLIGAFAATTVLAAALTLFVGSMTAYEYMYNGKVLGVVKSQQDVYAIVDAIGNKLTYAYGAEIDIDKNTNLSFKKVIGFNMKTENQEEILETFTYMSDMNAKGYAIKVGGKQVALLDTKQSAEELLQKIKDRYTTKSGSVKYKSVGFAEKVEIAQTDTKIKNIQSESTAYDYMMTGAIEKKVHVVKSGETFGEIAKAYGLKSKQLSASNPSVQPDKLKIGQELVLTQICPVVTVATTEIATYNAKIDYGITYQETSNLYKGEQTVRSSGVNGQKQVVAEIVRQNGMEVSRKEISAKILSNPVNQVVIKGTRAVPALIGTGTYIYPVRGATVSSRFGYRWGRLHSGVDLACPTGTWISAADGGTVISAGYEGARGNCIRINHGGNRVTVYEHLSKILVHTGQKVFQGQHIGNVGSTGHSTGPHLHFEVHVNGVAKNPLSYL